MPKSSAILLLASYAVGNTKVPGRPLTYSSTSPPNSLYLEGMREYPELFQALVVSRNQKWIPQIEQALQQPEPAFIVVGALHLLGKEGLVAALQDKGYSVEQW